jgi:hypothetical protein
MPVNKGDDGRWRIMGISEMVCGSLELKCSRIGDLQKKIRFEGQ